MQLLNLKCIAFLAEAYNMYIAKIFSLWYTIKRFSQILPEYQWSAVLQISPADPEHAVARVDRVWYMVHGIYSTYMYAHTLLITHAFIYCAICMRVYIRVPYAARATRPT